MAAVAAWLSEARNPKINKPVPIGDLQFAIFIDCFLLEAEPSSFAATSNHDIRDALRRDISGLAPPKGACQTIAHGQ